MTEAAPAATSVPGPSGLALVRALRRMQREPLETYLEARDQYGDLVRFQAGRRLIFLVSHPDDIQHILRDNYQNYRKGYLNEPLVPLLGQGLLTNEGESWLQQRRLIQPAFHRRRLANLADLMSRSCQALLQRWRSLAQDGKPINMAAEMSRLTLDVVGRALFGADTDSLAAELNRAFTVALAHINYKSSHPYALPNWLPTPANRRYRRAAARLDAVVSHIIAERRRRPTAADDLLGMLLEARDEETGAGMSDRQLRDEVITFLLAGHETTAMALSWAWHLLARHPHIAGRLRAELDNQLGGRSPAGADLARLPYTRAVLQETLRLFPPSVVIPRQANQADHLGRFPVPADTIIVISQYVTHRHPDFWPRPERVDPERFLAGRQPGGHPFAYLPFGAGPRICIGEHFALMEGQIILATLAQACELSLVPNRRVEKEIAVTLRPKNGLWMSLQWR